MKDDLRLIELMLADIERRGHRMTKSEVVLDKIMKYVVLGFVAFIIYSVVFR